MPLSTFPSPPAILHVVLHSPLLFLLPHLKRSIMLFKWTQLGSFRHSNHFVKSLQRSHLQHSHIFASTAFIVWHHRPFRNRPLLPEDDNLLCSFAFWCNLIRSTWNWFTWNWRRIVTPSFINMLLPVLSCPEGEEIFEAILNFYFLNYTMYWSLIFHWYYSYRLIIKYWLYLNFSKFHS